ncbi:MAG: hypothetical protein ACTHKU_05855 [Verrucomicrobiota bacterium]
MKAVATAKTLAGTTRNFYSTTLAPVNHSRETQFRAFDAVLMTVLFLELGVVMRLLLAN